MKNLVLLFTVLLMGLTTVTAAEKVSANQGDDLNMTRYRYAQPIMFVERGVEFLIFPNGSFDFNTNVENFYDDEDSYYRTSRPRRTSVNATFGAPGRHIQFSTPRDRGIRIIHDRDGKVRRIGNVFLNYTRSGKIKRVGSVYLNYNRGNGRLTQVGGLRVNYNHWGEIMHVSGQVKPFIDSCGICGVGSCTANHIHDNFDTDRNSDWRDNDDYYYYKKDGKIKKYKKNKKKNK